MVRRSVSAPPMANRQNKLPGSSPVHVSVADLVRWRARANKLPSQRQFRARAALAGQHQSRFRGRGVDYLESRHYLPGDDIRNMDWRVTARTGRAHTKVFQEERERPVVLVVDCNPSMYFATQGVLKSVMAAHLAALFAWSTVRSGDRIGGFVFGGDVHHEIEPAGGRRGVMRLLKPLTEWLNPKLNTSQRPMAAHQPSGNFASGENLASALGRLRRVARPGTMVVILSDFLHQDDGLEKQLSRLRQHNDVLACQILDPVEAQGLPVGSYPVSDGDRVHTLQIKAASDLARQRERLAAAYLRTPELMRRYGCTHWRVLTTDDPALVMLRAGKHNPAAEGME